MSGVTTIGFDADDTLWHNERFFKESEARFAELLADRAEPSRVLDALLATERRNLPLYGYGIKGFVLSMIETAAEIVGGDAPPVLVTEVVRMGREMLRHPIDLLPHVEATLDALAAYRLVVVTKGDLFDQERKLEASGLRERFEEVEIVSEKTAATYRRVFHQYGDGPRRAVMVGNSLRSDVLPALEAGSWGIHVPHDLTFALEHADPPAGHDRFHVAAELSDVPALIERIDGGG